MDDQENVTQDPPPEPQQRLREHHKGTTHDFAASIMGSAAYRDAIGMQSAVAEFLRSPAYRNVIGMQNVAAEFLRSPAYRNAAGIHGFARLFESPAFRNAVGIQGAAGFFRSEAFRNAVEIHGTARLLDRPEFRNAVGMHRSAGLLETPAFRDLVIGLDAVAGRLTAQLTQLSQLDRPRFELRVEQALRGWTRGTKPTAIVDALEEPKSLLHLGHSAEGVTAAVYAVEPEAQLDVEPWRLARAEEIDGLLAWLEGLNPKLARKFKGAWDAVGQRGPDWISQAANSGVELIDWSLRTLAPDEAVLKWQAEVRMYADEIGANGKPQRALKVRYIAHARALPASSVEFTVKAVTGILKDLQKIKHADDENMAASLRAALIALEHCLLVLRNSP